MITQKEQLNMISKDLLKATIKNRSDLDSFKRQIAKKFGVPLLKNSDLLKIYHGLTRNKREELAHFPALLKKRPVRSLSGVVNVSVLTKPYPCPGKCIFCPSAKNIPKSYLAAEPAVQRAIANKFNPYKQVQMRLRALKETGHPIDKVELRIIGGTWSYYPWQYQKWFVSECFRACNEFDKKHGYGYGNRNSVSTRLLKPSFNKLQARQKKNEKTKCRIIGISAETRPDYINIAEIKRLRELGITKMELGVQSIYDDVLKTNKRGHNIASTITATRLLKEAGFKVAYQMMLGLSGSTPEKDELMFKEIFSNPDFQPDYLKIYPLALVKNTPLHKIYKQKKYKPYSEKQLVELLVKIKKYIPYWCRVERVIRDIPSCDIIEGGAKILNLRETVWKEIKKRELCCKCIRCREVGKDYNPTEKLFLFHKEYLASGGREFFLSIENRSRTKLYALLRLRLQSSEVKPQRITPYESSPFHATQNAAIVRELHVYGQMAQINGPQGSSNSTNAQHKGLGRKLMAEAEKIAKENGFEKIAVISGIGVRGYYRAKLGYKLQNTYMVKVLS